MLSRRRKGRGRAGILFGSGAPFTSYRLAFISLDDSHYDALNTGTADDPLVRFAGSPPYELWVSVAPITQTKVTNWRTAFPGAKILAYVDLYHMETSPAAGTLYSALVPLLPDRWLRGDGDAQIIRFPSPDRGHYFWTSAALDILTNWLLNTAVAGNPILTKYDGLFIDNLPSTLSEASYQALINQQESGLHIGIGGAPQTAGILASAYADLSALLTQKIRAVMDSADIIICNTGATRADANINGVLFEQVTVSSNLDGAAYSWRQPFYGCQHVNVSNQSSINYASYAGYVVFMQDKNVTGRIP